MQNYRVILKKNIKFVCLNAKLSCYLEEKYQIYADEASKNEKNEGQGTILVTIMKKKQCTMRKIEKNFPFVAQKTRFSSQDRPFDRGIDNFEVKGAGVVRKTKTNRTLPNHGAEISKFTYFRNL
jgi:hypothetical protein